MIQDIKIEQFKGIENASLENVQNLNILVGKNNSGKSSILEALWLFSIASYAFNEQNREILDAEAEGRHFNLLDFSFSRDSNRPALMEIGFKLTEDFINSLNISNHKYSKQLLERVGEEKNVLRIKKEFKFIGPKKFRSTVTSVKWGQLELFLKGQNWFHLEHFLQHGNEGGRIDSTGTLNPLFNSEAARLDGAFKVKIVPAVRRMLPENRNSASEVPQATGFNIKNELLNLFHGQSMAEKNKFALIKEVVKEISPDSLDLLINITRSNEVDTLFSEREKSELLVPLESIGMGIHELLILIFSVVYFEHHVFCIEEPEIHMHSEMQRRLLNFLEKQAKTDVDQIFIATHSTVFIDQTNREGIFLVKKKNGTTDIGKPLVGQTGEQILEELGVKRSDLLQSDGLFFVEGDFDEKVIKEWSDLEQPNFDKLNIQIVQMGSGYRNMRYFAEAKILKEQAIAKVPVTFLIDQDVLTKGEIEKVKKEIRKIFGSDRCKILSKHELENYLLIPSSILNVVKKELPDTDLTESQIETFIKESCSEHRRLVLLKIVIKNLMEDLNILTKLRRKLENGGVKVTGDELEDYFLETITSNLNSEVIKVKKTTMQQKIKEAFKQANELLDRKWKEDKLNITPGKEINKGMKIRLWDKINKEINNFDDKLIAQIREDGLVPEEINEILKETKNLIDN